eukprot:Skav224001  [mRNA]  locus=scaffold2619:28398:30599:- [translate_table: standard]
MNSAENGPDMEIIFGSTFPDKILGDVSHQAICRGEARAGSTLISKTCLNAWRLLSIRQAQKLRRAIRLALSLRLRSLLRAWRRTIGKSFKAEVLRTQELLRQHQERKKLQYVRERMLHLRAACLFKIQTFRWTARVAQLALLKWSFASRISRLASSVYLRERREAFKKVMNSFRAIAHKAKTARFVAQKQQEGLLAAVLRSWQRVVKLKAQRQQQFLSKAKKLRNLRLKQAIVKWQEHLQSGQKRRLRECSLASNHRLRMLSNAFAILKVVQQLEQRRQEAIRKFRMYQTQRGLQALKLNAHRLRAMRAASSRQKQFVAQTKLKSWKLLYQSHCNVARLAELRKYSAQRLLGVWLHGFAATDILYSWQSAIKFLIKEAQADEIHQTSLKRLAAVVFHMWLARASSLQLQRKASLKRLELSRLGRFTAAWQGHMVEVRRIELHQKQYLAKNAQRILRVWQQNCYILRQIHALQARRCLQFSAGALHLWRVLRQVRYMEGTVERRLQLWALSSWAEWAALRRQVRDDVAWQRWADGIVDLFSTRRLLLGLPTCFASWSRFYSSRQTTLSLVYNKQLQKEKQIARMGFVGFRRILALSRFGRLDSMLGSTQRSQMLELLQHFRRMCCISSQFKTVVELHQQCCKERVARLHKALGFSSNQDTPPVRVHHTTTCFGCRLCGSCIVSIRGGWAEGLSCAFLPSRMKAVPGQSERCSSRQLAKILTSHLQRRSFSKMRL